MMVGLDFVAVDVETANSAFPESICQIGLAVVRDGMIVETISRTINSLHSFGWWQKEHLSICEEEVRRAPPFIEVANEIAPLMVGPLFSHTPYDRHSIIRACSTCGYSFGTTLWLDSAQVVRRAWPEKYAKSGYGLGQVAADLGIDLRHHDAGQDARAVAEIVIRASIEKSTGIAGWTERVALARQSRIGVKRDLRREGNVDGPLYGEVVVFTGGFESGKEKQAELAAVAGCNVANRVTKSTTLVVVGNDRYSRGERSGNWQKAEQLAEQGVRIRVMSEIQFRELIEN